MPVRKKHQCPTDEKSKTKILSATEKNFQSLGLITDLDFVLHLPLRYEDRSQINKIANIYPGMHAQLEGIISNVQVNYRGRKQLTASFKDDTGSLQLRWLNFYSSLQGSLEKKGLVRVRGEVRGSSQWGFEIIHPKISRAGETLSQSLTPIYPTTQGLSQESLTAAIGASLKRINLSDTIPEEYLKRLGLIGLKEALLTLHQPPLNADINAFEDKTHPAWQRLKFDEILAQQVAMKIARNERAKLRAPIILNSQFATATRLKTAIEQVDKPSNTKINTQSQQIQDLQTNLYKHVLQRFGLPLTRAQQDVLQEILSDMQRPFPMHRLVQGDVGSGKTIVAALAACYVLQQGYQVAVMAPTEILAEQLYLKMQQWFEGSNLTIVWLGGTLKPKEKRLAQEAIVEGTAQLIVGTQALIQKGVEFKNLALMIVDEQHRFGVGQRLQLSKKGERVVSATLMDESKRPTEHLSNNENAADINILPHQLNMSATPIPRTLAMTFLADLDISVIDELPPSRQTVTTKLIDNSRRDEVVNSINQTISSGQQVYWVCPLVEESEVLQLETAVNTHAYLQEVLPNTRVGLIHGRLSSDEKMLVMQAFKNHELDVLVATTVIEVGVDVANANLMVIEHAERFGLAQLHQLRGRVGRGGAQAICVLLYQTPLSAIAKERLKAMYETTDGFEIARRDLEQRGPGEFLGLRQSGMALTRFANLAEDVLLIEQARSLTSDYLQYFPNLSNEHMARWSKVGTDYLRS